MNENENIGFEDFESALFADDYQTDDDFAEDEPETRTEETAPEEDHDGVDEPEDEESPEDDNGDDPEEENAAETSPEAEEGKDATASEQTFTLKVNKEERTVNLEEMKTLAQKGFDYDRVKEQNAQKQKTIEELQGKLDANQAVLDILGNIAEKSGSTIEQLAETLYVNFRKNTGASEGAAREELKSAKLQKELDSIKAQQAQQKAKEDDEEAKAKKHMEEFAKDYPGVELNKELVDKLLPDLRNGMSLTAAYRKYEKAQDAAKIADLERRLAAKAQNDKNKRSSPGSQQDSGGRRTKTDYEEFERALFG